MPARPSRRSVLAAMAALTGCQQAPPPAEPEVLSYLVHSSGGEVSTAGLERLKSQFLSNAPEAASAQDAEFLLIGAGSVTDAQPELAAWPQGRPYALLGVSVPEQVDDTLRGMVANATHLFAADSVSLARMQSWQAGQEVGHAPDPAFSFTLHDDDGAHEVLGEAGLKTKQFLAVMPGAVPTRVTAAWREQTGTPVFNIDPEWGMDLAAGVYGLASALVSREPFAPILAAVNDTPAILLASPEDDSHAQTWRDVGLRRWVLPADSPADDILTPLMDIHADPSAAQADVHEAGIYARSLLSKAMVVIRDSVMS